MENFKEKNEKWFQCDCREWRYLSDRDKTNIIPAPLDKELHSCGKIAVYQVHKSFGRIFVNKNKFNETTSI